MNALDYIFSIRLDWLVTRINFQLNHTELKEAIAQAQQMITDSHHFGYPADVHQALIDFKTEQINYWQDLLLDSDPKSDSPLRNDDWQSLFDLLGNF